MFDFPSFKHYQINDGELFSDSHNLINGDENFLNQTTQHIPKFNGVPKQRCELFLKECAWRFNCPELKRQLSALKKMDLKTHRLTTNAAI